MAQRLGITLALCLILQSICGVLLQDPTEFGGGGNNAFLGEYNTQVPTVGENYIEGDDRLADGSLTDASFSGLEDIQTTVSIPTDYEGEEPADSSDTSNTETLSDVSPDPTVQVDGSEILPTALPNHTLDPSWLREDKSVNNDLSESNSTDTGKDIASAGANSTDGTVSTETNSTGIFNTGTNTTEVTNANSTEITNSTEFIRSSEDNSSNVTNPLTPGPTNTSSINDTTGLAEDIPDATSETIPGPTAENIPEPTVENTPEPTTKNIPETTAENTPKPKADPTIKNIPEQKEEDIPNDKALSSTNGTALAKAAAGNNQGSDSGTKNTANGRAWGVILGIAVTVGVVGLIIYVIQKRKHQNFSHSKLVEEAHPDPVLRLDNSEPLDLKYDGFGYYNPGLQGDNIQMSNFPSGRPH